MAREFTGQIRVKKPIQGTDLQRKLLDIIDDKEVMREIHRKLGERCEPYVPYKTGKLRASMRPYPQTVRWETPYGHYQYEGEIWGPNKPVFSSATSRKFGSSIIIGWRSGTSKHRTGRELGIPGYYRGWKFGYTTPGTAHHWLDRAMANGGLRAYSISVTALLKRRARKLNK